eukprot:TRINITY_DN12388_c0_g1_i2.p2 TRINITY_DN12388_c0_g1~~TRINITY_DN12388_c0_g1_i2.p2  ORF type:complete len:131 (-),score=43.83 TRINITY_DN12388_c0_g1_i2:226-618(-)
MCIRDRVSTQSTGNSLFAMPRAIIARWSFQAQFGMRSQAVELAQEWVSSFGVRAGLDKSKTTIYAGGIGNPTSLVELNTQFNSMSELETFFDSFHKQELRAPQAQWARKLEKAVVSGTPTWEVLHPIKLN